MNHYETIFIVDPDTPAADQEAIFEKLKSMIEKDGKLIMFDDWGNRKLAYEIQKKRQGRYVRLDYCGDGVLVAEIERTFRLDYRILKFMTVLLATNIDPDAMVPVEEEAAAAAVAEAPAEGQSAADVASGDAPETETTVTETTETESETEE
ncbi:MAG: 30S ribosomal protein S6 [Desulfobacterales bacterium CG23_combo_of_CG06-09_8_20_14_all_51_8]|nr:MAG: 30S ribosomal protein S6 [Desulfobacterales bacterium CG23_combo_of_CG06-09_8_20_14_all_51_8]